MWTILKLSHPVYSGSDLRCGGAFVPVLCGGRCVHCSLRGLVPAGNPLPAGRADSRLHYHVCAGVFGFHLWDSGPGWLSGGTSAWCEVCGDGLYSKLISSGHFVQILI